jgi:hypothetical protein
LSHLNGNSPVNDDGYIGLSRWGAKLKDSSSDRHRCQGDRHGMKPSKQTKFLKHCVASKGDKPNQSNPVPGSVTRSDAKMIQ